MQQACESSPLQYMPSSRSGGSPPSAMEPPTRVQQAVPSGAVQPIAVLFIGPTPIAPRTVTVVPTDADGERASSLQLLARKPGSQRGVGGGPKSQPVRIKHVADYWFGLSAPITAVSCTGAKLSKTIGTGWLGAERGE